MPGCHKKGIIISMFLLLHIIIALGSLVYTTYLSFKPSKNGLYVGYGLIASTLASGTYLVWSTKSPMLQACTTGLTYLAVALTGIIIAHHRLAKEEISNS
jgi:hypothetical protein